MDFYLAAAFSLCIVIPAIIGLIRFRKINKVYFPFIYYIWLGLVNETISYQLAKNGYTTIINNNIYVIFESFLLIWQFQKWKLFERKNNALIIIISGLFILWITESFIISDIYSFNSYFSIIYSSVITFMSIIVINQLLVVERKSLLMNPIFIICVAFVIHNTFYILSEVFWIYGINENKSFRISVFNISVITNFISIILYTHSILWMPIKHRFTLPSS